MIDDQLTTPGGRCAIGSLNKLHTAEMHKLLDMYLYTLAQLAGPAWRSFGFGDTRWAVAVFRLHIIGSWRQVCSHVGQALSSQACVDGAGAFLPMAKVWLTFGPATGPIVGSTCTSNYTLVSSHHIVRQNPKRLRKRELQGRSHSRQN